MFEGVLKVLEGILEVFKGVLEVFEVVCPQLRMLQLRFN